MEVDKPGYEAFTYEMNLQELEMHTKNHRLFKQIYTDEECIEEYYVGEMGPKCPYSNGLAETCGFRIRKEEDGEKTLLYSVKRDHNYEPVSEIFAKALAKPREKNAKIFRLCQNGRCTRRTHFYYETFDAHKERDGCMGSVHCRCPFPKCIIQHDPSSSRYKFKGEDFPALRGLYDHHTVQYELDLEALEHFTQNEQMFYQGKMSKSVILLTASLDEIINRREELLCIENYHELKYLSKRTAKAYGFKIDGEAYRLLYDIFRENDWKPVADIFAAGRSGWERAPCTSPMKKTRRLCYNPRCCRRQHVYGAHSTEYMNRRRCRGGDSCECPSPKCLVPGPAVVRDGWLVTPKFDRGVLEM